MFTLSLELQLASYSHSTHNTLDQHTLDFSRWTWRHVDGHGDRRGASQ